MTKHRTVARGQAAGRAQQGPPRMLVREGAPPWMRRTMED